ncbi:thiopeptide-type bacteriocin biosynthesis protein [Micromonospora sp. WMMD1082]|uniref:thiopeptide-type bacteriocin biosynthesis protein n=1 Tax=Micromonospora sp. WMMD1082 TaxID=3016104 RepID=UPI0024165E09|nr:thiopeptide-type bacteriocin biosynthesis protein [Micromonospora sp. WMMD1082]MDG4795153.1 thiopeptide-type bacteriocin biosynthesis protein [Micromonospora sp. WMMD1082]
MRSTWSQLTIAFPDPRTAADVARGRLAPVLAEAEARRLITAWFFVRKGLWRLRYLPTVAASAADAFLHDRLALLNHAGHLAAVIPGIYEPEIHAFGGTAAMDTAHQLWHHDSRHLLTAGNGGQPARSREASLILCTAMMRAAALDRYEQGDVWARVADHRDPPDPALIEGLQGPVHRLLTVDLASLTPATAPLAPAPAWIDAYTTAGATLDRLNQTGQLRRGLREILTHHVIFAWNRRGVPGRQQAAFATTAKTLIFGPDPATTVLASIGIPR